MSAALSLPGSTAPPAVGSVSGQPHPSLKITKQPFSPESIKWVQNLMSKNTAAALALIGIDEAISHINAVTAQEFDAETEEDSPDEESNDGPSDWDLEEDEKVSLLSDEEDEEATGGEVAADQTVDDEVTQAPKPDKSTEDNFDEAPDDEYFVPGNDNKKEGKKCDN